MTEEATDRSDLQKMQIGEATDLVARLRDRAASYRMSGPSSEHTAAILDEAAAEIETARRLLKRFDREWNSGSGWAIRMDDLGDEVRAFLASRTERADG